MSQKQKTFRPIAEIEADIRVKEKPGPDEGICGNNDHRLVKLGLLLTELKEARKFWTQHNESAAAQDRDATLRQLHNALNHSDGRSVDSATEQRLAIARGCVAKLFAQ